MLGNLLRAGDKSLSKSKDLNSLLGLHSGWRRETLNKNIVNYVQSDKFYEEKWNCVRRVRSTTGVRRLKF